MTSKLIDIHPHIISDDNRKYPIAPLGGKRSDWSAERPFPFEQLVAGMDAAGVDKAAIVHSSTTYGYDNSYVADVLAANPGRFTGVFSIDVVAPDAAEKVRYWVGKQFTGIRLFTAGSTGAGKATWMDDSNSFAAWDQCMALGIPVCISMRQAGLPNFMNLLKRYPDMRFIMDHLMLPPIEEGPPFSGSRFLFDLARHPNIYLKLTTNNVRKSRQGKSTPEAFIGRVVSEFGSNRVAWGSNFPASESTLQEMVTEVKSAIAFLPGRDQENILCRTAQSLYPALADQGTAD